jgi:hypothetical protein
MRALKPEASFQTAVLDLALHCGWRRAHFRASRTAHGWRTAVAGDGKGFPDLVMIRRGRLIIAELKVPPNSLTPEQEAWLAAWREVEGAEVYVWTPDDFEAIRGILV